ncbi:protein-methionine-sulfoxide reductase heme-binding subunit MsrQ [Falsirhodobacter sp. 20TX0035]|uniref:protein-methionine-sulfoxide reductase heme-binding subunit MsrQ n=1 Tax=Falsirhodobacter sp. 20TX0035 TaxID=3022019 RepID=UPI00232D3015|nr:protein-methionine-sulfoxide reductase heme-binding subunit MsrQ [Falsirhodobacter sp. 20TX0035]MDB6452822.1 protein-methionine-sulfoxide reductase heme-binding subunit MsrQ [Falsirhodobacter sp. 20TX0035]
MQALQNALRRVPPWAVYLLGLIPLAWLVTRGVLGDLGVDPVRTVEHDLGLRALQWIVAGLAISPLRWLTGINLVRFRRAVGLVAFFYAMLHLSAWLFLDIQLNWSQAWSDILRRPYITIGMLALLLLVPLAATSNNRSIRWLKARWQKLHHLVYVAAVAGGLHYLLVGKVWIGEALIYFTAIVILLALRATHRAFSWP